MSIKIKVRDYLAAVDKKLDKSIDRNLPEPMFKGHAAPDQKPRELWLLPPDDLCRHWTVTDKEPTSVGWIHVQVLEVASRAISPFRRRT